MSSLPSDGNRAHMVRPKVRYSAFGGIRRACSYLSGSEKINIVVVLFATLLNASIGIIGLASVVPFVQLLVMPDPLNGEGYLSKVFRHLGIENLTQAVMFVGAGLIILIAIKNVFAVYHTRLVGRFCARVETRLATKFLGDITSAPFTWALRQNSSILRDVVMSHVVEVSRGIIRPALALANSALMILTALAFLMPFTPVPALLVGGATIGLGFLLVRLAKPKIALASGRKRHHNVLAGVSATEAISGVREVRMSPAGSVLLSEFRRNYSTYAYSDADARQWQIVPRSGLEIIGVCTIVLIAVAALLSGNARTEIASILTLYAVVAVRLLPVMGEATSALSTIQSSLPALSRLDDILIELSPTRSIEKSSVQMDWKELSLRDVSFHYAGGEGNAVENTSLKIERGKSYGIVGASGAGKSTLADLISGLLEPTEGVVEVDGLPLLSEADREAWRSRIAYVAQAPLIFDFSLRENILLGQSSDGHEQRFSAAIKNAGLTDVANSLPQGLDTPIGDRGTRLSGGQRQRVAIARAMFQQADMLVLDEATSALDSVTEQDISDAIDSLRGHITIVAIAHRLSTLSRCDEIILIKQGKLHARGTHSQLLENSPEYCEFVDAQVIKRQPT